MWKSLDVSGAGAEREAGQIVAQVGSPHAARSWHRRQGAQNSKFTPRFPGYYGDVFNKVGGQSMFHLTVC